ncbi:MAG: hypothetical protein EAZ15_10480 [Sphingobacteriales bacterium]|nr:MAG: hypothetical protein EAZ15_10480 [Sphingobacteriales bacterium]
MPPPPPPANSLSPSKGKVRPLEAGDGKWDLLGFGYDVTGQYANESSSGFKIINVEKLKLQNSNYVLSSTISTTLDSASYGENAEVISTYISKKIKQTAGFKLFKGALDFKTDNTYADSSRTKLSSNFVYASHNFTLKSRRLRMMSDINLLKNYLEPSFVTNLNNLSSQDIVRYYGTHILTDIILGAKLEILYKSETKSSDRNNAAKIGLSNSVKGLFDASLGLQVNIDYSELKNNFNSSLKYRTIGGDLSKGLRGEVELGSPALPKVNIGNWQSGVNAQNSVLIDISYDGLIPIYELVADPTKKAALKAYITKYLIDGQVYNGYKTAPIYQFYYANQDHFTTSNPRAVDGYSGWRYDGVDFRAFSAPAPETVPVYTFLNIPLFNHFISTDINATWGYADWQPCGIDFYAYKTQVPGTIPIYLYYSNKDTDHFTTSNPNIASQFIGWQKYGIAFYAYPANYTK